VQPDGKIVVAGTTRQTSTGPGDFIVARFLDPAGTSDTGFGSSNGGAQIDLGGNDIASAMVLQPDGKILVAGTTVTGSTGHFAVTRLLPSGSPDNTFGNGGRRSSISEPRTSHPHRRWRSKQTARSLLPAARAPGRRLTWP
jgi:uncharacterized delta-60 repeat protein